MKNTLIWPAVVILAVTTITINACVNTKPVLRSKEGINFTVTSLDSALLAAKKEHKPLFVFAHASWCPTCKKMEQEVLNRKELGTSFNDKIVNVAIDIDSKDGKALKTAYPITGTPTLFFYNAEGALIKKIVGFTTASELLTVAEEIKQ